MAYKYVGMILTTYKSWDDPPSCRLYPGIGDSSKPLKVTLVNNQYNGMLRTGFERCSHEQ